MSDLGGPELENLCNFLPQNLQGLILYNNTLTDNRTSVLSAVLKKLHNLKSLSLFHNHGLTSRGFKTLAETLKFHTNIHSFHLEDGADILCGGAIESLAQLTNLHHLRIRISTKILKCDALQIKWTLIKTLEQLTELRSLFICQDYKLTRNHLIWSKHDRLDVVKHLKLQHLQSFYFDDCFWSLHEFYNIV